MGIFEREVDGVVILDLRGKMTLGVGDELLAEKINSVLSSGRSKVLLNMTEVPYVDASGLGEIVRSYIKVRNGGSGQLKLLNISERIKRYLNTTKLITVFEVFSSEEEALKSFKQ